VREKDFFTPDPSLPLYFGVTAKNSVDLAQKMGFNVHFVKQTAVELPRDITPFRTNTMHTLRPIAQIGDIVFNRSSTAETLFLNAYQNLIKEYKERRQHKLVQL
jgi:branched-subunit amino acid aminotransferase/4-amino-4-deoxychorismate lyase